jgi:hypothetical protein
MYDTKFALAIKSRFPSYPISILVHAPELSPEKRILIDEFYGTFYLS